MNDETKTFNDPGPAGQCPWVRVQRIGTQYRFLCSECGQVHGHGAPNADDNDEPTFRSSHCIVRPGLYQLVPDQPQMQWRVLLGNLERAESLVRGVAQYLQLTGVGGPWIERLGEIEEQLARVHSMELDQLEADLLASVEEAPQ